MILPPDLSGLNALQRAERTLIGEAGLIHMVQAVPPPSGDPQLYFAASRVARLERVFGRPIPGHQGGVGFTWEEAAIAAIGETVERYCAAAFDWSDLIYDTAEGLGRAALGVDEFVTYPDDVFSLVPLARWSSRIPCHWVRGRSLVCGSVRYVPACLVYVPYRPRTGCPSDLCAFSVSSGQSCHPDLWGAIASGLCEVIERDAFLVRWARHIQPTRLDYESDSVVRDRYQNYFANTNVCVEVFDITLDVPVATALALASGSTPRGRFVTIGVSAHFDERVAVLKALRESMQTTALARHLVTTRPEWRPLCDYANVRTFEDRIRLYCEPNMTPEFDFIVGTESVREIAVANGSLSLEQECRRLISALAAAGFEVVVVDLATPEIAELGYNVVKVFVPGLAHLSALHLAAPHCERVVGTAVCSFPLSRHGTFVNPAPHPFP